MIGKDIEKDSGFEHRPVLDVADVAKLEQAIAADGTSLAELMERAGNAIADEVQAQLAGPAPVVVLCGSGNNGGDGWVCARALAQAGWPVTLVTPRAAEALTAEPARSAALKALAAAQTNQLLLTVLVAPNAEQLKLELNEAHCIVDAILGTGFSGTEVREPYATWIRLANQRRKSASDCEQVEHNVAARIVAADVPSGMSAQTGLAAQPCIHADATVTMIVYKPGLVKPEAARWTGSMKLAPLVNSIGRYSDALKH